MPAERKVLVTGGAGFIGSHLAGALLADGWSTTVVDNFEPFYDPLVKRTNVRAYCGHPAFRLVEGDIRNLSAVRKELGDEFDAIIHLAARAGVRPSIRDPQGYLATNVNGTQNVLDLARDLGVKQFIFASSSSVYGVNPNVPWREADHVLNPISPYAGTKVSGELLGHVYSHLYGIRFVALRFFTVYGPGQRPDLAIHKFAKLMLEEKPVPFYGDGSARRDYTYIDDIVSGILAATNYTGSMYEVINLGNNYSVSLSELVSGLERVLGVRAQLDQQPEQPGDVWQTWADVSKAKELLGYEPKTAFRDGLQRFAAWLTAQNGRTATNSNTAKYGKPETSVPSARFP
jgi:UDP-glucuronate 4-epimerase